MTDPRSCPSSIRSAPKCRVPSLHLLRASAATGERLRARCLQQQDAMDAQFAGSSIARSAYRRLLLPLVAHPVRAVRPSRRRSKSFRMSPTARAAQARSDDSHIGVPSMAKEPAAEFFCIDYSQMTAIADDEKIGADLRMIDDRSQRAVGPQLTKAKSSAVRRTARAGAPMPR